MLAVTTTLIGWATGFAVGVVGVYAGLFLLRLLARRLSWWGSLVAPLLLFGPAAGLLVTPWVITGDVDAALYWYPQCPWGPRLGWSLIFFFGATGIYGFVRAFLASRFVAVQMGVAIPDLLLDALRILLMVVMLFVVVVGSVWGGQQYFSYLITATAGGSIVVGFALQETLQNFFAGMAIVSEHTYNVGEWVWVGEEEGEVIAITRRTTKLRTRTNDVVTIPNRTVMQSKVRNESLPTAVHADFVYVTAAYAAPPNFVRDVLKHAALEVPKVLRAPAPIPRVNKYDDSGVTYQLKIFVTDIASVPDIKSDVMAQIWYWFRREGIEIPYPVRELRRRRVAPPTETDTERRTFERLSTVPFFAALTPELLHLLAHDSREEVYGAGERVVLQGDRGDTCYVVDDGRLSVLVTDGKDENQVAVLEPGALFGEMSLLTGEPRSATVRTIDDARLFAIGSRALRAALSRSPELATHLAEVATLRREGLLEARATLDAQSKARVRAGTKTLGDLIRRFFQLPEEPA